MQTTRRPDGWWITKITEIPDCDDCGPYSTRAEAEEDQRGLERFAKWGHLRSYWTCEPEPRKPR